MALTRPDFENLSTADLQALIDGGVAESLYIEYKSGAYGANDAGKKELLKDVSAFANASGGHLLIGIAEENGEPTSIPGTPLADRDAEVLRLENLLRDGIEPRVIGLRVKVVALASGSSVVVMRIPKSWIAPHRVCFAGWNKIWLRNSAGAHEASMDELRHLFEFGAALDKRIAAYRSERLALIRSNATTPRPLGAGQLVMHIFPLSTFATTFAVDIAAAHASGNSFMAIDGTSGMRVNFEGVVSLRGEAGENGYTQLFRNGTVEAVVASLVNLHDGHPVVAGLWLERNVVAGLDQYVDGLRSLSVPAPLAVAITIQGCKGAHYAVTRSPFFRQILDRDVLELPICVIDTYTTTADHIRAIRPALDALWNSVGCLRDEFFDETGAWHPPQ